MADVTYGAKVPEELKKQLEDLQKDSGLRTGKDFMQSLVNSYVLEKTKEDIPQVAEDLKELQTLTQRINNIYLNLGYRIENITKAQKEQQEKELNKKNGIISDLQEKNESSKADFESLTEAYNNIVNQNSEYLQRVNELTESNNNIKALVEEYKTKNDMLLGDLAEYKQYKVKNEELKKENETLSSELNKLTFSNNSLLDQLKSAKEEIDKIKNDSKNVLGALREENKLVLAKLHEEHENALKQALNVAEIEKEKTILEIEKKHQKELQEIQNSTNNEINSYQAKVKILLDEIENIKSKIKANKKETVK